METSIIILNYNGKKYLRKCFASLFKQTYADFEILFVDNASEDGSADFVRTTYAKEIESGKVRVIVNDKNYGFAEGNNIGYRKAKGKYAVFLNNDIVAEKQWLQELVSPLQKYHDVHVVGTSYYEPHNYKEWLNLFYKKKVGATLNLTGDIVDIKRITVHESHLVNAFYVSGNGTAIRKAEFKRPFDPDYFAYAEDTYLGWLAHLRNFTVVLNLNAKMLHVGGGTKKITPKSFNKFLAFHGTKNQMMNFLIFYELKNVVRILPLFAITQLTHIVANPRHFKIKIHASWWVLTHLRAIAAKRREVQRQRKIPDKELIATMSGKFFDETLARLHFGKKQAVVAKIMNAIFLFYCWLLRIKTRELV